MIKLAFYKAHQGNLTDKIISWWTKGPYSHVEIVVGPDVYNLLMYSSSGYDKGVRIKKHKYDPAKWEYIDIDIDINVLHKIYKETENCKYDYVGILGFIVPFRDKSSNWFCSEWCSNIVKCSGNKKMYLHNPSKLSPNDFYNIIKG
jgi:hypothetical protein